MAQSPPPNQPENTPPEGDEDEPQPSSTTSPRLDRLQQELYSRHESNDINERQDEIEQLGIRGAQPVDDSQSESPEGFANIMEKRRKRRRKILISVGITVFIGVLFAVTVFGTLWYRSQRNVTSDQIGLTVTAPADIAAGEEVTYEVVYSNESLVDWQDVEVTFEPPSGFTLLAKDDALQESGREYIMAVGDLESGEEQSFSLSGRIIGTQNASVVGQAQIEVTPKNYPSGRFDRTALMSSTITAVPLEVSIASAQEATPGQHVKATIRVTNNSGQRLEGAYLELQPPAGMTIAAEDPQFSAGFDLAGAHWQLPPIEPLDSVSRDAVVVVDGQPGEQRTLNVSVGLSQEGQRYEQQTANTVIQVAASELTIDQQYNKTESPLTVNTGERIQGVITFTNTGTTGIRNAVVKAHLEGDIFDPATLQLPAGAYEQATKTITWTSASVPELAVLQPGESGEVQYSVTFYPADQLPDVPEAPNTLVVNSTIDSPDVVVPVGEEKAIASDRYVISVNTDLELTADAFYDDGRLGLTSTGPLPPKVGEKTTYTVRLRVGSSLNELGDTQITAVLPDGVSYTGESVVTQGEFEYNDRTNEVSWSIPQLPARSGQTGPPAELHLQVAITPAEHQQDSTLPLLSTFSGNGIDTFTETTIEASISGRDLPDTATAAPDQGRVE